MAHHTISVSEPESIDLVRYMIEDFIPLFRSNKFNICGDETFDLGAYRNKNWLMKRCWSFICRLLNEIIKIVKENGRQVLFGRYYLNIPSTYQNYRMMLFVSIGVTMHLLRKMRQE